MLGTRSILISVDPDKSGPIEIDLYVCNHCRKTQHAPPPTNAKLHGGVPEALGGICHGCHKMICLDCVKKRRCEPLEQWLEKIERKHRPLFT